MLEVKGGKKYASNNYNLGVEWLQTIGSLVLLILILVVTILASVLTVAFVFGSPSMVVHFLSIFGRKLES